MSLGDADPHTAETTNSNTVARSWNVYAMIETDDAEMKGSGAKKQNIRSSLGLGLYLTAYKLEELPEPRTAQVIYSGFTNVPVYRACM
jgi:hypothetical protein